jgi:hypothetical protein
MRRTDVDEGFGRDDQTYNLTTQSIEVPDRQTIVGILASVKNTFGSGTIETLGISCINNKGTLLPPNLHLKLGENEGVRLVETLPRWRLTTNPFVRNSTTAMVCLERVRRIGISTATVRRSVYISGLCLEFWDLTPPLYIGHWVKEVDWLLLNQGDEIERIKYWRLHGRLLGIRIEKSGSGITGVEVHGNQVSDEVCDERPSIYTANQFERLDELKWISNSTGSLITIQTRPTDSAQGMLIGDFGSAMANESLFWEIQDSEGKTRAVTHIHAYFHFNGQKLCGFEFCYQGKLSRCVGHTSGVKASAVMGPDERVTCATTNISWNYQGPAKDDGVVLHTNAGREVTLSASSGCRTRKLSSRAQGTMPSILPECHWHKAQGDMNPAEVEANYESRSICLPPYACPTGPSVGIYVEMVKWPIGRRSTGRLLVQEAGALFVDPCE